MKNLHQLLSTLLTAMIMIITGCFDSPVDEESSNRAPEISPVADVYINVYDIPLSITLSATDPDDDAVTLNLENKPSSADFDESTGTFSWQPGPSDKGEYTVTILASDGTDQSELDFRVNVILPTLTADTPFVIVEPRPGDTFSPGDTLKVKWYFDRTVTGYSRGPAFRLYWAGNPFELYEISYGTMFPQCMDCWNADSPEETKFGTFPWVVPDTALGMDSQGNPIELVFDNTDSLRVHGQCSYCETQYTMYSDDYFSVTK